MSKLIDQVAESLGEAENLQLLMSTAADLDRRQVMERSGLVMREMLARMAELAADPSTVGEVQRSLGVVAEADDGGPIRLVRGRFETAGASLVRCLDRGAEHIAEVMTCVDDPLAAPVAWLLAAAIGRHGPSSPNPEVLAHFLEREHRRSIGPVPPKPVATPGPSHRSPRPVQAPTPVGLSGPAASTDHAAAPLLLPEETLREREPGVISVFAGYLLVVGAILWLLSVILSADDLDIVLTDVASPTTMGDPTTVGPRFTSIASAAPVASPVPQAEPGDREDIVPESGDPDGAVASSGGSNDGATPVPPLEISFTLVGPLGASGATGEAEVVFDPEENQICHRFEVEGIAAPTGRLGIGRSDDQAGVVVDLGLIEPGRRVCTQVSSTAMEALFAAETDHFIELGDAGGGQLARGQTSARDGEEAVGAPEVDAGIDSTVAAAELIARPGVLTLIGAAPSQATAELLRSELAVLDGTDIQVIDRLTIDPTAAPPTGGIKVDQTDLFAVDSHDLSSGGETVVRELASLFLHHPEWAITVSGHTDSTGDEINNLELGLRRATEVRDILIAEGIPAEQITAEGVGAPNPIADNETPEGRAQNRRFEIEIKRQ